MKSKYRKLCPFILITLLFVRCESVDSNNLADSQIEEPSYPSSSRVKEDLQIEFAQNFSIENH